MISRFRPLDNPLPTYVFLSGFVFFEPSVAEIFFLFWLIYLLVNFKKPFAFPKEAILLFLVLIIIELFSLLAGSRIGINFRYALIDLYLFSVFFFFLCYYKERPIPIKELAFAAFLAGLVGFSYYLIVSLLQIDFLGLEVTLFGGRYKGFFKDPNVAGPFLILPLLYYLEQLMKKSSGFQTIPIIFVLSAGVFLSFSRAAWLNLFCGISVLFLIKIRYLLRLKTFSRLFVLFSLVATFSFFLLTFLGYEELFLSRLGLKAYDQARFAAQKIALESPNLFLGYGPGGYSLIADYAAHSLFIRHLGEMGIIGLFITFLFIGIAGYGLYTVRKEYAFLFSSFVGIIANSFFVDTWHWRHFWVLIIVGYIELTRRSSKVNHLSCH